MRLTKIICTMGPACNTEDRIRGLAERGMNIARLNFSHGSHESQREVLRSIRAVNEADGRTVGLLLDTKGPEIRTGDVETDIVIKAGETVVFSHANGKDDFQVIKVNYPDFWKDAKDASCILIDNGEMIFDAKEISADRVVAVARGAGAIGSRRHINIPGSDVSLPSISDKDWEDIKLACDEKMDYIALSFIRSGKEVEDVRAFCKKNGHPSIQLIAKIENKTGVTNIDGIIESSDGVMVARGDLGAEIPPEDVPGVQDQIVMKCRTAKKPVIVATHMLESMIENPTPTRAEVTDIAYAAMTGADCTMLSGETARGKYPYEAVEMMSRVLVATEKRMAYSPATPLLRQAHKDKAAAVIVRSNDGSTAKILSMPRPAVPVVAVTNHADIARSLQIHFGIVPVVADDNVELVDAVRASNILPKDSIVICEHDGAISTARI